MKKSLDAHEAFVQAWQASASLDDAIQKLEWTGTRRSFIRLTSNLRRKGVPLKQFRGRRPNTLQTESSKAQFIRVWQTSGTISEVADRLGMSYGSVMKKALRLRKEGVYLKRYLPRRILQA